MHNKIKQFCSHNIIIVTIIIFLGSISLAGYVYFNKVNNVNNNEKHIRILCITDLHGFITENDENPGIDKVAMAVKNLSKDYHKGTILLSAGDMFHSQASVERKLFKNEDIIEVMNLMQFDAMSIGNHEFDFGRIELENLAKKAKFPFLAANTVKYDDQSKMEFTQNYIILEKEGLKIGIIGLNTDDNNWNFLLFTPLYFFDYFYDESYYKTLNAVKIADEIALNLKKMGVNIVIVLAHFGGMLDEKGIIKGEIADFAFNVNNKNIDLIIAGHTHQTLQGTVNNIPIIQAGCFGRALGIADIVYSEKNKKIETIKLSLLKNDELKKVTLKDSEKITYSIDNMLLEAKRKKEKGFLKSSDYIKLTKEEVVLQSMLFETKADIAILPQFILNGKEKIFSGNLTEEDFDNLFLFYDFPLYVVKISGEKLQELLERGIEIELKQFFMFDPFIVKADFLNNNKSFVCNVNNKKPYVSLTGKVDEIVDEKIDRKILANIEKYKYYSMVTVDFTLAHVYAVKKLRLFVFDEKDLVLQKNKEKFLLRDFVKAYLKD